MKRGTASRLLELESSKLRYGPGCDAQIEKLLGSLRSAEFSDAALLIQFHDLLLFLRAFPQSRKTAQLAEKLLAGIGEQVARLRQAGADMDVFDPEQVSGIAGTVINDSFTYEVARWLAQRHSGQIGVEWNLDEQGRQMAVSLPRFLPLLADDSLVEADTPFLDWMASAAGGANRILPWLLQRFEDAPLSILQKTAAYDSLKVSVFWDLDESPASRTRARRKSASDVLPPEATHPPQRSLAAERDEIVAIDGSQTRTPRR